MTDANVGEEVEHIPSVHCIFSGHERPGEPNHNKTFTGMPGYLLNFQAHNDKMSMIEDL